MSEDIPQLVLSGPNDERLITVLSRDKRSASEFSFLLFCQDEYVNHIRYSAHPADRNEWDCATAWYFRFPTANVQVSCHANIRKSPAAYLHVSSQVGTIGSSANHERHTADPPISNTDSWDDLRCLGSSQVRYAPRTPQCESQYHNRANNVKSKMLGQAAQGWSPGNLKSSGYATRLRAPRRAGNNSRRCTSAGF